MIITICIASRKSLSARRAWIEMQISVTTVVGVLVALRKESVDRNCYLDNIEITEAKSLSARRAWIEICGGVSAKLLVACRSPQGERG